MATEREQRFQRIGFAIGCGVPLLVCVVPCAVSMVLEATRPSPPPPASWVPSCRDGRPVFAVAGPGAALRLVGEGCTETYPLEVPASLGLDAIDGVWRDDDELLVRARAADGALHFALVSIDQDVQELATASTSTPFAGTCGWQSGGLACLVRDGAHDEGGGGEVHVRTVIGRAPGDGSLTTVADEPWDRAFTSATGAVAFCPGNSEFVAYVDACGDGLAHHCVHVATTHGASDHVVAELETDVCALALQWDSDVAMSVDPGPDGTCREVWTYGAEHAARRVFASDAIAALAFEPEGRNVVVLVRDGACTPSECRGHIVVVDPDAVDVWRRVDPVGIPGRGDLVWTPW